MCVTVIYLNRLIIKYLLFLWITKLLHIAQKKLNLVNFYQYSIKKLLKEGKIHGISLV